MQITVGISEMKVTSSRADVLVTYSIGSCVGLSVYDPEAGVGGIIHCMLPLSKIDRDKAKTNPDMFTDTGVPRLLQAAFDLGATRERLVAKVAGGAGPLQGKGVFNIGERNCVVLRSVLEKNNIPIAAEDVGGTCARTMSLYTDSGKTTIRSGGLGKEL